MPIFYPNFKACCILSIFFLLFILRGNAQTSVAAPYDILINEFMPDPTPQIGLPNSEYIELYNRSTKSLNLNGFKLINGTVVTDLPAFELKPNKYVVVYTKKSGAYFSAFGDTLPITKLITISNPGDVFYLKSPENVVIDAASFDISFYQNSKKAEGGWSLERINIKDPCNTRNWIASIDLKGGTPGQKNSVYQDIVDKTPPQILNAYPKDDNTIILNFDKSVDRNLAILMNTYQIDNNITISNLKIIDPLFDVVELTLKPILQKNILYSLILKTSFKDCQGNPLSKNDTIKIQLAEKPKRNDLVINELLMDPETGGSRFIELYNRSEKVIDLYDLKVADVKKGDTKSITGHYFIFPKKYVTITPSPLYIENRYKVALQKKGIVKNILPTWDDALGNASIYTYEGSKTIMIDSFNYHKNFHNPLLANTEGVSLERINPEDSTNIAANWHSAAASVLYATPAYQNSQFQMTPSVSSSNEDILSLLSKTFSPNDDGFQDFLLINYKVDSKGYLANVFIFDMSGRLTKTLTVNELLAAEGQFKWDGETDQVYKAPMGTYIIYAELIDPNGGVKKIKKLCVLSDKY